MNMTPAQIEPPPCERPVDPKGRRLLFTVKNAAAVPTHPQAPAMRMQRNPITLGTTVEAEEATQPGSVELGFER